MLVFSQQEPPGLSYQGGKFRPLLYVALDLSVQQLQHLHIGFNCSYHV